MKRRGTLQLLFLVLAVLVLGACTLAVGYTDGEYGKKLSYMTGRTIILPDFSIEYVGDHRVATPQYPRGFLYRDFQVKHGDRAETVSWTDGTGVLGPIEFTFNGAGYTLELANPQTVGTVGYGTMIVEKLR